jgi:hypothetical protein
MPNQINPATGGFAITPNNSTDLARVTRGIYVGGTGNLNVDMADGTTVLFTDLVAGVVHPLAVKRVRSTSTTATSIVGIY